MEMINRNLACKILQIVEIKKIMEMINRNLACKILQIVEINFKDYL